MNSNSPCARNLLGNFGQSLFTWLTVYTLCVLICKMRQVSPHFKAINLGNLWSPLSLTFFNSAFLKTKTTSFKAQHYPRLYEFHLYLLPFIPIPFISTPLSNVLMFLIHIFCLCPCKPCSVVWCTIFLCNW